MKALLGPLACALLVLAAGCLEGGGPGPVPGNGSGGEDPVGGAPGTPGAPGTGARYGRPPSNETTTDGIVLTANASSAGLGVGQNLTVEFRAKNDGATALVAGGPCDEPWRIRVYDANGTQVEPAPRTFQCRAATIPTPFPSGAELARNFTWNGTLADGSRDGKPASPGAYRIEATFGATRGASTTEARVSVTVVVVADPTVV